MWITAIISRLKLQHFLVIAVILLTAFSIWALGEVKFQKSEKLRQKDNYTNLRDMDSMKVAHLTFKTKRELEDYIDTNEELSKMLDDQDVKIRKLQNLVYQKQTYIDNMSRTTDVSNLVEDIRKNVTSSSKWKDSTECLVVEGDVTYKDDSLSVNVNKRKFDNTILITGYWERNQRNLWTRIFGRKIATAKATSKCGESETIIIDKKK